MLKRNITILLIWLIPLMLLAQDEVPENVWNALKVGDSKEISKYFGNTVELTIIDKPAVYSKVQAEIILKEFFAKHTAVNFSLIRKNTQAEKSKYAIGSMNTSNGDFIVYFFIVQMNGMSYVQELKIENASKLTTPKRF